jgi:glutamate synthase (NADPH/NADH) large chain
LRAKFTGKPEHVVNYFFFVAEEARQIMAQLGVRTYDELIGRVDLLNQTKALAHWKAKGLDLSEIFYQAKQVNGDASRRHVTSQDHGLEKALDHKLIAQAQLVLNAQGAAAPEKISFTVPIRNVNRTVGAMLSGLVARQYGHAGLPDDTLHIQLQGAAGQSFAAFLAHGITLDLVGEGNDYVGKGLSGGRVIVRPPSQFQGVAADNIICGNTVLYGAIAGEAFISGVAGERFAVRNSGATAVVEGVGDHGCEYMTGGTVVVLGSTGRNFAAGMSGGIAYVYDEAGDFASQCNTAMVELESVLAHHEHDSKLLHSVVRGKAGETDETILRRLIERHQTLTGSVRARTLLDNWATSRAQFVKVFPSEYKKALALLAEAKLEEIAA